jgi:hypothetical protein
MELHKSVPKSSFKIIKNDSTVYNITDDAKIVNQNGKIVETISPTGGFSHSFNDSKIYTNDNVQYGYVKNQKLHKNNGTIVSFDMLKSDLTTTNKHTKIGNVNFSTIPSLKDSKNNIIGTLIYGGKILNSHKKVIGEIGFDGKVVGNNNNLLAPSGCITDSKIILNIDNTGKVSFKGRFLSLSQILKMLPVKQHNNDITRSYAFYQGKDHGGDSIKQELKLANNVAGLKMLCDGTEGCVGFNTSGTLKSSIPSSDKLSNVDMWKKLPQQGIYKLKSSGAEENTTPHKKRKNQPDDRPVIVTPSTPVMPSDERLFFIMRSVFLFVVVFWFTSILPTTKLDSRLKFTIALLVVFIYAAINALKMYFMSAKTYTCGIVCPNRTQKSV